MGHAVGASGEDLSPVSLFKHAKALGLLKAACDLSERCAGILKRYWLAGRAHLPGCSKFFAVLDDSRFQTSSMCAAVGAQRSNNEHFLVASSPPQENARANIGQGCSTDSGCAGGRGRPSGGWPAVGQTVAGFSDHAQTPRKIPEVFSSCPRIPGGFLILPENSRKYQGGESIVKYTYKSTFPEIPGNPRKFEKVMFPPHVFSARRFPEIPGNPRKSKAL